MTHSPLVINRLPPAKFFLLKKSRAWYDFELLSETKQILDIKELLEHGGKITDYLNVVTLINLYAPRILYEGDYDEKPLIAIIV